MTIDTALILCAGFGKRLNPITLDTPKPLLKIKDKTLLENCINLIKSLDIKKILINSFYLKEQIHEYVNNLKHKIEIRVIEDGDNILNTGGGILNLVNQSTDENFLILNPDTLWSENYTNEINNMIDLYLSNNFKSILLLVKNNLSFDKNLTGDFGLESSLINQNNKSHIYTGCQILNKSVFNNESMKNFPINKIWAKLMENKELKGYESNNNFYHVTNLEIFKKLRDL